jgi:hypothetical protein
MRVAGSRKNGGAKGCGKAAEWKSQKTTFPLSHSLGDCERLTKNRYISFTKKKGHF